MCVEDIYIGRASWRSWRSIADRSLVIGIKYKNGVLYLEIADFGIRNEGIRPHSTSSTKKTKTLHDQYGRVFEEVVFTEAWKEMKETNHLA